MKQYFSLDCGTLGIDYHDIKTLIGFSQEKLSSGGDVTFSFPSGNGSVAYCELSESGTKDSIMWSSFGNDYLSSENSLIDGGEIMFDDTLSQLEEQFSFAVKEAISIGLSSGGYANSKTMSPHVFEAELLRRNVPFKLDSTAKDFYIEANLENKELILQSDLKSDVSLVRRNGSEQFVFHAIFDEETLREALGKVEPDTLAISNQIRHTIVDKKIVELSAESFDDWLGNSLSLLNSDGGYTTAEAVSEIFMEKKSEMSFAIELLDSSQDLDSHITSSVFLSTGGKRR